MAEQDIMQQMAQAIAGGENSLSGNDKAPEPVAENKVTEQAPEVKPETKEPEATQGGEVSQEDRDFVKGKLDELANKEENKGKSEEELREALISPDSSLNKGSETDQTAVAETPQAPDINSIVKERTAGKFDSFDAMLSEMSKEPQEVFADERIKKLNDLAKQGVDIVEILKFQNLGIKDLNPTDTSDALALIKHEMRLNDPDITDRQMELMLKKRYSLDSEEFDEEEIELSKAELRQHARKAKEVLAKREQDLSLPSSSNNSVVSAEQRQALDQRQKELADMWNKTVDSSLVSFEAEDIVLGEDQVIKYKLTPDDTKSLKQTMSNPDGFFRRYIMADGTTDMNKLRSDMLWISNRDKIIKVVAAQSGSNALKQFVEGLKNPSQKGSVSSAKETSKSVASQIADQMFGPKQ